MKTEDFRSNILMTPHMIKHDLILGSLEQRVREYNRYGLIMRNFEYNVNGKRGEVDLLAWDDKHKMWHFYEVKSGNKPSRHFKAHEQYQRFKEAFPDYKSNGILVNNKGVYRL